MNEEQKFYNAVNLACEGDYFKIKDLAEKTISWEEIWRSLKQDDGFAELEWEKLQRMKIILILKSDPAYPPLLKEIPHSPFGIYVKGSAEVLKEKPAMAIVGTRKATPQGREIAFRIAHELSKKMVTIVSGLALGIDESAHKGVMAANGKTVAVLACGLERIYPAQNQPLAEKILASDGAVISEYPLGSVTYENRFLERNRIVSGLSLGTIVVEAPARSGSLATARFALEQNREVFVVPGFFGHKNYDGSHKLIKDGASLVANIDDVFEFLKISPEAIMVSKKNQELPLLDEDQKILLQTIENEKGFVDVDKLIEVTRIIPHAVNRSLTQLLLKDLIKETGGKYYI